MKKILILLFSFITYGFSITAQDFYLGVLQPGRECYSVNVTSSEHSGSCYEGVSYDYNSNTKTYTRKSSTAGAFSDSQNTCIGGTTVFVNYVNCRWSDDPNNQVPECPNGEFFELDGKVIQCSAGIDLEVVPPLNGNYSLNPDGTLNLNCNDGYSNNNGTCETTPPNSDGFNEDGSPKCKPNYSLIDGTCQLPEGQNEDGTCQDGYTKVIINIDEPAVCQSTGTGGDTGSGGSTGGDTGDSTDTGSGGSTGGDTGDSTDTGSGGSTVGDIGTDTGDTGSGGGTGGGVSGGDGNTSNEGNTDNTDNDIPQDSVENNSNCSDPNLSLQEKMLCEINEGTKKINNEADPSQSLNNLLKDLRDNNQKDNTAINTNIKDIESLTKDLKTIQNSQLSSLGSIKTGITSVAGSLSQQNSVTASTIDNPINNVDTQIDSMTSEFSTFINNQTQSFEDLKTKVTETTETLKNGFSFNNLAKASVTSCPLAFTLDLSDLNVSSLDITLDICEYTSMLYPYMYPFFYIILSLGVIYLSISLIKVF